MHGTHGKDEQKRRVLWCQTAINSSVIRSYNRVSFVKIIVVG